MANFSISYLYQIVDRMSPTLKKINDKIKSHTETLKKNESAWARLTATTKKYMGSVTKATHKLDDFNNKLLESTGSIVALGASVASIAFPVKKAMEFQSAMTDLAKVSPLERGTKEFKEMEATIKNMSEEMGVSTTEIAKMMESGARLGIQSSKELQDFARLSSTVVVALGMSAEEAGDKIGSLRGKFHISIAETSDMLDAVNTLETKTSASAEQILDTLERASTSFVSLGISPEAAASISAVANQIATSSDTAATSLKIMFTRMQTNPELAAKMVGDPLNTIREHLNELAKLPQAVQTAKIFKEFGSEALPLVQGIVKNMKEYDRILEITAYKEQFAGSMTKEYEEKQKDLAIQLEKAKIGLNNIAMEIGTALIPIVGDFANLISENAKNIREFINRNRTLVIVLASLVAGFFSLIAVSKLWQLSVVAVNGAMLMWNATTKAITATMAVLRAGLLAINIVMFANPIGILVAGVGAFAAALAGIIIYWDDIKAGIDAAIESATEFVRSLFCGDAEQPNVTPKMSGADASGSNSGPKGAIDINVTGTNAQVTGTSVAGKGLKDTGLIKFSSFMNK